MWTDVKNLGKRYCPVGWKYSREIYPRAPLVKVQDAGLASHPMDGTPTQRLADLLLPTTLLDFVQTRRDSGRSWRLIARDLHQETHGHVDVTAETLRGWFGPSRETAA